MSTFVLMLAFPSLSITSSTPFTFNPFVGKSAKRVTYLDVQLLAGSADIYVGPYPDVSDTEKTVVFSVAHFTSGNASQNASDWEVAADVGAKRRHLNVKPGWVVTACSNAAHIGKYVTQVDGDLLIFDQSIAVDNTQTMTLAAPYYADIENGFLLSPGMWKEWTAEHNSAFLSTPLRFAVASGTGLLNVQYAVE